MKIVECQQGHYGKDCSQKCSMNCYLEDHCDRFNGKCDEGCKPGWTGNTCDQRKVYYYNILTDLIMKYTL